MCTTANNLIPATLRNSSAPIRREAFIVILARKHAKTWRLHADITWHESYIAAVAHAESLTDSQTIAFCVPANAIESIANYKRDILEYLTRSHWLFAKSQSED